jgi:hypothetical protein
VSDAVVFEAVFTKPCNKPKGAATMQQLIFPKIAEEIQAGIAQLEADLETINQARKDKKAELKRAQKSLRALNGQGSGSAAGRGPKAASRTRKEAAA